MSLANYMANLQAAALKAQRTPRRVAPTGTGGKSARTPPISTIPGTPGMGQPTPQMPAPVESLGNQDTGGWLDMRQPPVVGAGGFESLGNQGAGGVLPLAQAISPIAPQSIPAVTNALRGIMPVKPTAWDNQMIA